MRSCWLFRRLPCDLTAADLHTKAGTASRPSDSHRTARQVPAAPAESERLVDLSRSSGISPQPASVSDTARTTVARPIRGLASMSHPGRPRSPSGRVDARCGVAWPARCRRRCCRSTAPHPSLRSAPERRVPRGSWRAAARHRLSLEYGRGRSTPRDLLFRQPRLGPLATPLTREE